MTRRALPALFALLALGPFARTASANPLDTYGFGSRETALGGAVTADTEGFAAAFYNPAGLSLARGFEMSFGYFYVGQRLSINGKDNGVDPVRGVVGGLVAPGTFLGLPFAFGVATHLPDDRLSRVRTLRQEIPRWELFDNRGQLLFVDASLAIRPFPWLALGGGVAFLSSTRGTFGITGTATLKQPYDSQLRHEVDADLTTVRIPILGLRIEPDPRVSIGLTYRGESKLDLHLSADIHGQVDPQIKGLNLTVPVSYALVSQSFDAFHPRQVALGTSARPSRRLRLNLDFVWTEWSSYKSATSETSAHLSVDTMGLPIAVPPDPKPAVVRDPSFHDRLSPHLGAEFLAIDHPRVQLPVRVGYIYEKSPVPPQSGPTNFVDSDRHSFSAGLGVRLLEPMAELPGDVRLDLHVGYAVLPQRVTTKANPSDYVGDYTARGYQKAAGATLGATF